MDFVPRPLAAVIFLYPITEKSEEFRHEEEARVTKREQDISPQVMFFKQTISNACGMMALIHSLANNKELLGMSFTHNTHHEINKHVMCMYVCIGPGLFQDLINKADGMTPEERAELLEGCEQLANVHETGAQEGQTKVNKSFPKDGIHLCLSLIATKP